MRQLSGNDAFMLYAEGGGAANNLAGLQIYDPSTAPGGKVEPSTLRNGVASDRRSMAPPSTMWPSPSTS